MNITFIFHCDSKTVRRTVELTGSWEERIATLNARIHDCQAWESLDSTGCRAVSAYMPGEFPTAPLSKLMEHRIPKLLRHLHGMTNYVGD